MMICHKYISFKPCYKWNAFNTWQEKTGNWQYTVLNLVISGMPSIPNGINGDGDLLLVLNLVISGMPSIQ